jgi:hypothetical protein
MNKRDLKNIKATVTSVIKPLSERNRDIIARRFGLSNGKRETLESIGQSYGITRERVRQIEESTLAQLSKTANGHKEITRVVNMVKDVLAREGGVMKERDLFGTLSGNENYDSMNASLAFLLTLNRELVKVDENDHFHAYWAVDRKKSDAVRSTVAALTSAFEKKANVLPENQLHQFGLEQGVIGTNGSDLSERQLMSLMAVSKDIARNIFGEVGLVSWSQVKPKGVRDKAYLIMKKEGTARHFADIAKLINGARFDKKAVNIQTVHNELIKDNRFVLVGRGMYALAEWGYKSGTVKEVLVDILKNSQRPMPKADLVARVMDARMVKENTILLNLQDSSHFVKNEDGTYALRKA